MNIIHHNLELCKAYGFVSLAFDGPQLLSRTAAFDEHVGRGDDWLCRWLLGLADTHPPLVEEVWHFLVFDTLLRRAALRQMYEDCGCQMLLEGVGDNCIEVRASADLMLCVFAELAYCTSAFSAAAHQLHAQGADITDQYPPKASEFIQSVLHDLAKHFASEAHNTVCRSAVVHTPTALSGEGTVHSRHNSLHVANTGVTLCTPLSLADIAAQLYSKGHKNTVGLATAVEVEATLCKGGGHREYFELSRGELQAMVPAAVGGLRGAADVRWGVAADTVLFPINKGLQRTLLVGSVPAMFYEVLCLYRRAVHTQSHTDADAGGGEGKASGGMPRKPAWMIELYFQTKQQESLAALRATLVKTFQKLNLYRQTLVINLLLCVSSPEAVLSSYISNIKPIYVVGRNAVALSMRTSPYELQAILFLLCSSLLECSVERWKANPSQIPLLHSSLKSAVAGGSLHSAMVEEIMRRVGASQIDDEAWKQRSYADNDISHGMLRSRKLLEKAQSTMGVQHIAFQSKSEGKRTLQAASNRLCAIRDTIQTAEEECSAVLRKYMVNEVIRKIENSTLS